MRTMIARVILAAALILAAAAARAAEPAAGSTAPAGKSSSAAEAVRKGADAYAVANYPRAEDAAREALELDPRCYQAYNLLGFIHLQKNQLDLALADFSQAVAIAPDDAAGFSGRGSVLAKQGQYDKAVADFDRSIAIAPKVAATYVNRSNCYYYQGEWDKALADLNQADTLQPKDPLILTNRGNVYFKLGDFDKAIADYKAALAIDPSMKETYIDLAFVYVELGQYDRAIAIYTEILDSSPSYAPALAARGLAAFREGFYSIALTDLDRAVAQNPKSDLARGWRAWLHATCPDDQFRDGKKALADARAAGELNAWRDADYWDILAAANAEVGKFEQAAAVEKKAIALNRVERNKPKYQERLELYQAGKPYREKIVVPPKP